jgi:hypothetical protein
MGDWNLCDTNDRGPVFSLSESIRLSRYEAPGGARRLAQVEDQQAAKKVGECVIW